MTKRSTTEMAADIAPPADRYLQKIIWTESRARNTPYVRFKEDGTAWIGDRRLLYRDTSDETVDQILATAYRMDMAPQVGVARFHSWVLRRYIGIPRSRTAAWLTRQEPYQRYQEVHKLGRTKTTISRSPLVNWATDVLKLTPSNGFIGVMNIMDLYTRLAFIVPIKSESSAEAKRAVRSWLTQLDEIRPGASSKIRALRSDNGTMFKSAEFQAFCHDLNIRNVYTTPANPQGNGAVERLNRTVRAALTSTADVKFKGNPKAWVRAVDMVQTMVNHTWSRMLGRTPVEAARTDEEEVKADMVARTEESRKKRRYTNLYDRAKLNPGEYVRISLRVVGTADQRQSFKSGVRRPVGQANWSEEVYKVRRKTAGGGYKLVDMGDAVYDRMDLLKLPAGEAAKFFDEEHNG